MTEITPPPLVSTHLWAFPPLGDAGKLAEVGFVTLKDWYVLKALVGADEKVKLAPRATEPPLAAPGLAGIKERSSDVTSVSPPSG